MNWDYLKLELIILSVYKQFSKIAKQFNSKKKKCINVLIKELYNIE